MTVTLRPNRPQDYDVVRRWIDDPVITGGFPTAAPVHGDAEVRAIVRDERCPNHERLGCSGSDTLDGCRRRRTR